MESCDVLVVGGGPAGSSFAWALKDTALDILIIDKKSFPRDKVCAGWVTPAVMQELDIDLIDYQKNNVLQPISGFKVSKHQNKQIKTSYGKDVVSYGIRRREFDDYLLQRCGARVKFDTPFKSMQRDGDYWIVNDNIKTKLIVGAGGHFCPVARAIGAKIGSKERSVAAQEIEFEMTPEQAQACTINAEVPELFFCDDLEGYGWVFRKGNFLNIGLGREDTNHLSEHVTEFADYLKRIGKIPESLPDKFHGHAYILYPHAVRKLVSNGVMLIGDAAGLAYPQSGEGIRPAIESALLAAKQIKRLDGSYSEAQLQSYAKNIIHRFGKRDSKSFTESLPGWLTQMLASRLLATEWFIKNVVMNKWFLQSHQSTLSAE